MVKVVEEIKEEKPKRGRGRPKKEKPKTAETPKKVKETSNTNTQIKDTPLTDEEIEKLDKIEEEIKEQALAKKGNQYGITIEDLCDKVMQYCEAQAGITLYPYQKKFGERLVRSLVLNEGEELTALFSRQSGRL